MTKFHFYVLASLICWVGVFNCSKQALFWFLFFCIYFWALALWWAWENRPDDVK
jgi:hypothetical protein